MVRRVGMPTRRSVSSTLITGQPDLRRWATVYRTGTPCGFSIRSSIMPRGAVAVGSTTGKIPTAGDEVNESKKSRSVMVFDWLSNRSDHRDL